MFDVGPQQMVLMGLLLLILFGPGKLTSSMARDFFGGFVSKAPRYSARAFLTGRRLLSVALFLLVILSGLLGQQNPSSNFAPTFVWITWWVSV